VTQIKYYRIRLWLVFLIRFKFVTILNPVRLDFTNRKNIPVFDMLYVKEGAATDNSKQEIVCAFT